jgi:hypothetical protein
MVDSLDTVFVYTSIAVVLLTPIVSSLNVPWYLLDTFLVKVLLFSLIVVAITLGPLPGLFTTLAVVTLFFERNRHRLATSLPAGTPSTYKVQGSPVPPLAPTFTSIDYSPHTDNGEEMIDHSKDDPYEVFYEHAPESSGLDHKDVLLEAPRSDSAPAFYKEHGLL